MMHLNKKKKKILVYYAFNDFFFKCKKTVTMKKLLFLQLILYFTDKLHAIKSSIEHLSASDRIRNASLTEGKYLFQYMCCCKKNNNNIHKGNQYF